MSTLSSLERRLVRLFVAATQGDWGEVARVRESAPEGEPNEAWREAMLQLHLFAGFPRQVEAYGVIARAGGLGPESSAGCAPKESPRQAGAALFSVIYQKKAQEITELLYGYDHNFGGWILEHAYGSVLARGGLEPWQRELLAVGALAAQGQHRQLASHTRGAVRCGARPEQVMEVIDVVADLLPAGEAQEARSVIRRFTRR